MPWSVIESHDDDGEIRTHILPVVEVEGFDTEQEAWEFLDAVEKAGDPCVTDEDGTITRTYFGHELTPQCACAPRREDGLFIHRLAN